MKKSAKKVYKDPVVVKVYGTEKTYERKEALREFQEGMACCEGSEQERYCDIVCALMDGYKYIDNDRGVNRMAV